MEDETVSAIPKYCLEMYYVYFLYDRLMKVQIITFNRGVHMSSRSGCAKVLEPRT